MNKGYHILEKKNSNELTKLLAENGQALMPMVELIEQSKIAVDELLENLGRATLEAALLISAASTLLETEKSFRKIMGFKDLWMLDASLKKEVDNTENAA